MPTEPIDLLGLGSKGLFLDTPPYALDVAALSYVSNVRLAEGQLRNFPGHVKICQNGLEVVSPYYIQGLPTSNTYYWIVFGLDGVGGNDLCITDGSTKTSVNPDIPLLITPNDQWTGGIFNGVSVVTNGRANYPLYLSDSAALQQGPVGPALQVWTGKYEDLPFSYSAPGVVGETWRTQSLTAGVLRPFKNFLIALDITKSNERYPYLVKWSDAADPGFIPAWDETDPTLLAGEYPLAEEGGFPVDLVPLGDLGMIYKEDSIWSMSLVGGQYVFNIRKAVSSIGALAPNCVAEFMGQHIVLGHGDIVIHNGSSPTSIVDKRIKNYIFRVMDTDNYKTSFIARNDQASEIWMCIPSVGNVLPNFAAVWNWRDDTWTIRELAGSTAFIAGVVDITQQNLPTEEPWGSLDGSEGPTVLPEIWGGDGYPVDSKIWTERDFNPVVRTFVSVGESGIFKMDDGTLYDMSPAHCQAERRGIPLSGHDRQCKIRRVYPLMEGNGTVQITIGAQATPSAPVTWETPQNFTPGEGNFINVRSTGKLHAWRISSDEAIEWSLYGFRIYYTEEGFQ